MTFKPKNVFLTLSSMLAVLFVASIQREAEPISCLDLVQASGDVLNERVIPAFESSSLELSNNHRLDRPAVDWAAWHRERHPFAFWFQSEKPEPLPFYPQPDPHYRGRLLAALQRQHCWHSSDDTPSSFGRQSS